MLEEFEKKFLSAIKDNNTYFFKHLLRQVPDAILFEIVFDRLQNFYRTTNRKELKFGSFRFVVHDGSLQFIEENSKNNRYLNQDFSNKEVE